MTVNCGYAIFYGSEGHYRLDNVWYKIGGFSCIYILCSNYPGEGLEALESSALSFSVHKSAFLYIKTRYKYLQVIPVHCSYVINLILFYKQNRKF